MSSSSSAKDRFEDPLDAGEDDFGSQRNRSPKMSGRGLPPEDELVKVGGGLYRRSDLKRLVKQVQSKGFQTIDDLQNIDDDTLTELGVPFEIAESLRRVKIGTPNQRNTMPSMRGLRTPVVEPLKGRTERSFEAHLDRQRHAQRRRQGPDDQREPSASSKQSRQIRTSLSPPQSPPRSPSRPASSTPVAPPLCRRWPGLLVDPEEIRKSESRTSARTSPENGSEVEQISLLTARKSDSTNPISSQPDSVSTSGRRVDPLLFSGRPPPKSPSAASKSLDPSSMELEPPAQEDSESSVDTDSLCFSEPAPATQPQDTKIPTPVTKQKKPTGAVEAPTVYRFSPVARQHSPKISTRSSPKISPRASPPPLHRKLTEPVLRTCRDVNSPLPEPPVTISRNAQSGLTHPVLSQPGLPLSGQVQVGTSQPTQTMIRYANPMMTNSTPVVDWRTHCSVTTPVHPVCLQESPALKPYVYRTTVQRARSEERLEEACPAEKVPVSADNAVIFCQRSGCNSPSIGEFNRERLCRSCLLSHISQLPDV